MNLILNLPVGGRGREKKREGGDTEPPRQEKGCYAAATSERDGWQLGSGSGGGSSVLRAMSCHPEFKCNLEIASKGEGEERRISKSAGRHAL